MFDFVEGEDAPGEVASGEPVAQVGGQQERLVAVAAQEVVGHGPFCYFATFVPNASSCKNHTDWSDVPGRRSRLQPVCHERGRIPQTGDDLGPATARTNGDKEPPGKQYLPIAAQLGQ